MQRDTPILRTVLGQGQSESPQPVSLVCHPDSADMSASEDRIVKVSKVNRLIFFCTCTLWQHFKKFNLTFLVGHLVHPFLIIFNIFKNNLSYQFLGQSIEINWFFAAVEEWTFRRCAVTLHELYRKNERWRRKIKTGNSVLLSPIVHPRHPDQRHFRHSHLCAIPETRMEKIQTIHQRTHNVGHWSSEKRHVSPTSS